MATGRHEKGQTGMILLLGIGAILIGEFVIIVHEIRLGNQLAEFEAIVAAQNDPT
jgi:hypothetical protein